VCCEVLAAIAAQADDPEAAEALLAEAGDLLAGSDAGLPELLQEHVAHSVAPASVR
jgi:hypothetical protein